MCGSELVGVLIRQLTLALALSSAFLMFTASIHIVVEVEDDGAAATGKYPPFLFLTGIIVVAAILETAAIHLGGGGGGDDDNDGEEWSGGHSGKWKEILDGAVLALLNASTAMAFIAACEYRWQKSSWDSSGEHVYWWNLCLAQSAGACVSLAAGVKGYYCRVYKYSMPPHQAF